MNTSERRPDPAEIWSSGDYAAVCDRMIPALGARLVEVAGVGAGEVVLDVACGTGNAALPAAVTGAVVTALDIAPKLLRVGAARAAADGVHVTWVHGDAGAMPFDAEVFDCVLSCVGIPFCADQDAASREVMRVCRRAGRIGLVAWTPEGVIGQVLAAVGRAAGAPSPGAASPLDWGREDYLEAAFAGRSGSIRALREQVDMPAESASEWVDYMAGAYGPLLRARNGLESTGAWSLLRQELIGIVAAHESGAGGGFWVGAEYLAAIIEW